MKNFMYLLPLLLMGASLHGASKGPSEERIKSWEKTLDEYSRVQNQLSDTVAQRNPNAIFDLQPPMVQVAPIENIITISNNSLSSADVEKMQAEVARAKTAAAEAQKELEDFRLRRDSLLSELKEVRNARADASPAEMQQLTASSDVKMEELILKSQQAEENVSESQQKLDQILEKVSANTENIALLKNDVSEVKGQIRDASSNMSALIMLQNPANLPYDIIESKGGRFVSFPGWLGKERSDITALYPGKIVFTVERSGKNLNFVRDIVEIEAFGQISRQISIDMEQRFGLTKDGADGDDQKYREAVINIIGGTSRSVFSGLSRESDWWELRSPKNKGSEETQANYYYYTALYSIDQKRLNNYIEEQIKKQLQLAELPAVAPVIPAAAELPEAIEQLTGNVAEEAAPVQAVVPAAPKGNPSYVNRLLKMLRIYEAEDARLR